MFQQGGNGLIDIVDLNRLGLGTCSGVLARVDGGSGNDTLKLMASDVMDMSGFNTFATTGRHQLLIKANSGDVIDLADGSGTAGWTHAADTVINGVSYQTWNHDTVLATVYVDPNGQVV